MKADGSALSDGVEHLSKLYGKDYYETHCGGLRYSRDELHWASFFGEIAAVIEQRFNPGKVFDAGCAHGFLVEALRKRGIETFGRDFSEFAISQLPPGLSGFCELGSITDPIQGPYDLVTCIEVLEHMPETTAAQAVANLCGAAPRILFSSSPDDFTEPTHINVQPPIYWLRRFAEYGFAPTPAIDASFLCPWAMALDRSETGRTEAELQAYAKLIALRMQLAEKDRSFARMRESLVADGVAQKAAHEANEAKAARMLSETDLLLGRLRDELASREKMHGLQSDRMRETDLLLGRLRDESASREKMHALQSDQMRAELDRHTSELDRHKSELATARDGLARAMPILRQHDAMVNSTAWRIMGPWRALGGRLPGVLLDNARVVARTAYWAVTPWKTPSRLRSFRERKAQSSLSPPTRDGDSLHDAIICAADLPGADMAGTYDQWVQQYDTLSDTDCRQIYDHIRSLASRPKISVIMPVFNTPERLLREAIGSVLQQLYPNWELCIADDASTAPHVRAVLQSYADDERIKVVYRPQNGHISASSNSALQLATGDFVALMDHDDLIPAHALYEIAVEINAHPSVDMIYTDEDHFDGNRRTNPYFKTDWNPDLVLGQNCVSHFGVYRRSIVDRIGGFRQGFEGSQDHDLTLRFADETSADRIRHIPSVLYHWRKNDAQNSFSEASLERCLNAARRAINDHLARRGETGVALAHPKVGGFYRVKRALPDPPPLVSLVVPTKNRADLLRGCLEGLLEGTVYPSLEIIIVDHESDEPETISLLDSLARDPRLTILPYTGPFNYSAMNNRAVRAARGSIIGLINNDIEIIRGNWLAEMVSHAILPGVGAVGARLLYSDGRVQHGGVVLGVGGVANHFSHLTPSDSPGYFGRAMLTSTVSAVTGACLIVKRSAFEEVGGLDEVNLTVAFNDVDFCLKLREAGYRNVYVPAAELYHLESASRGSDSAPQNVPRARKETAYMIERWGKSLQRDPFHNPNFDLRDASWGLASPSRRVKPWKSNYIGQ